MRGEIVQELFEQLTGEQAGDGALRTLLDALPDAIVVVDSAGSIVFAGGSIRTLSGYEPAELAGRPIETLVPVDRRARHVDDRDGYLGEPHPRGMGATSEIRLAHRDGHEVPVDVSLSPIEFGGHRFVVAAVRDATAREQAEQALKRALQIEVAASAQLRDLDVSKDAFLRAVSHDLRTPLTVVHGLAETLATHAERLRPDEVAHLAGRLTHNAQRLTRLVTDLLDVDRLTRGAVRAERRPTEAVTLVRDAIERCVPAEREVHLEAPASLTVEVDPAQAERIVENLLVNAVRHTPDATSLTVRIAPDGDDDPRGLRLAVEDQGRGVPVEDRERVFEPFVRLDESAQSPGSGVGLSLVAEFARLHGGAATVTEAPGGGAAFHVWLPASDPVVRPPVGDPRG